MPPVSEIVDVIVEPRYDTQTILAAGALTLTFFQVPVGQGQSAFAAAGVNKNLSDTNMDLPGQLPAGYNFRITGFRVQPAFTLTPADARQWSVGAWFTFTIGSKPFLRVPLDTIPAGMGPFGYGGATVDALGRAMAHGVPHLNNAYGVGRKPFTLFQTQNFNVQIQWTALSPVTSVVPTQVAPGLPIRVFMDGYLTRSLQ